MSLDALETLIEAQAALIAALDAGDVAAIERATGDVHALLPAVRAGGQRAEARERVGYAMRQADAARIRVNFLTDRTRDRADRLATARGERVVETYSRDARRPLAR